jgi:nicotinamidase-related amidase
MSYTLVVVDMQDTFPASRNRRVRANCKREIMLAMERGADIIFVEYIGQGPTIPSLVRLTDSYHRVFFTRKSTDDGSKEVTKTIKDNRLKSKRIKIVGVNTNCCVLETVSGLSSRMKKSSLEVMAKACNSSSRYYHLDGLGDMFKMPRVSIKTK